MSWRTLACHLLILALCSAALVQGQPGRRSSGGSNGASNALANRPTSPGNGNGVANAFGLKSDGPVANAFGRNTDGPVANAYGTLKEKIENPDDGESEPGDDLISNDEDVSPDTDSSLLNSTLAGNDTSLLNSTLAGNDTSLSNTTTTAENGTAVQNGTDPTIENLLSVPLPNDTTTA